MSAVAYSGGVDSALVLAMAHSVLNGRRRLPLPEDSASLAQRELDSGYGVCGKTVWASNIASSTRKKSPLPTTRRTRSTDATTANRNCTPSYVKVADQYHLEILSSTAPTSTTWGITDPASTRRARRTYAVRLCEAGMTKQDVRDLARQLELPVWDKPAMPCLSSRIPV